jgi:raffinose/stachyose/melibiose transport system permease protein
MGPVFASIVVAALPMVIIYAFLHSRIQSGMVAGAVKG